MNRLAKLLRDGVLASTLAWCAAAFIFADVLLVARAGANPFKAVVIVNDLAITRYEVDQRILLMRSFGLTDFSEKRAISDLIDDRIRLGAAEEFGLSIDDATLEKHVSEFAARDGLDAGQLRDYVARRGVEPETLHDFVRAGVLWNQVVQARYGSSMRVSEGEIDSALSLGGGGETMVLISEIILLADNLGVEQTWEIARRLLGQIRSGSDFAEAARRFSAAQSGQDGGKLDWLAAGRLPPQVAAMILTLQPGQVAGPVQVTANTVGLFMLRDIRSGGNRPGTPASISYVRVSIPDGASDRNVREIVERSETCDDLKFSASKIDSQSISEEETAISEIPEELASVLVELDRHEARIYADEANAQAIYMVCGREVAVTESTRDEIRNSLYMQRLAGYGQSYLQRLRGNAYITYK